MRTPRPLAFVLPAGRRLFGRPLGRLRRLVRRREVQVVAGLWLVVTVVECFSWSTGRPSYWSALVANILVGVLGIVVGVAAVRDEQAMAARRAAGEDPALPRAARGPLHAVIEPIDTGSALLAALLLVSFAILAVHGRHFGTRRGAIGAFFYVLMPFVSIPVGVTVGVALGLLSRNRIVVAVLGGLTVVGSVVVAAWPCIDGPQLAMFDHLLGWYIPYPSFWEWNPDQWMWFRLLSIGWVVLGVGLLALGVDETDLRIRFRRRVWPPLERLLPAFAVAMAGFVAVYTMEVRRTTFGFYVTDASAAASYAYTVRSEHFVIHYGSDMWSKPDPKDVRRMVEAHELAYHELSRWMHLPDGAVGPITSYVGGTYSSQLFGGTIAWAAKPWRNTIYVDTQIGHRPMLLKLELAYVLAGHFGRGPLHVATRDGLLPEAGFENGFVLATVPLWWTNTRFHRRAKALRSVGFAPGLRDLLGGVMIPDSSTLETPRAVCAASFITWLKDTRGIEAVERAFHAGDVRAVGDPATLFRQWNAFLDTVPTSASDRAKARDDLKPVSYDLEDLALNDTAHACAFGPSAIEDAWAAEACAKRAVAAKDRAAAAVWMRRTVALQSAVPPALVAPLDAALSADELDAAWTALERIVEDPRVDPDRACRHLDKEGDKAWSSGRTKEAARDYQAAVAVPGGQWCSSEAAVKLATLEDPVVEPYLRPVVTEEDPDCTRWGPPGRRCRKMLRDVRWAIEAEPGSALAHDLLGELLDDLETHPKDALAETERALQLGLPRLGGRRVDGLERLAHLRFQTGDTPGAIAALEAVEDDPDAPPLRRGFARHETDRYRFVGAYRARHRAGHP